MKNLSENAKIFLIEVSSKIILKTEMSSSFFGPKKFQTLK